MNLNLCVVCGNSFTPYRPMNKTCSKGCRVNQILQQKKDYYQMTKNTKQKEYRDKNKIIISKKRRSRYLKNKEHENAKHKEWYNRNRHSEIESAKKRMKEKYELDPVKINKYNMKLYYKYHEKRKAHSREYAQRENIRPKRLKLGRIYYQKNREIIIKRVAEWHKLHPESSLKSMKKHIKKMETALELPNNTYSWALQSWSKTIRKINGNYCAICGSTHKLNSHHIFYKSQHPELSLNINNGIPLCKEHHLEVHRLNPMVRS